MDAALLGATDPIVRGGAEWPFRAIPRSPLRSPAPVPTGRVLSRNAIVRDLATLAPYLPLEASVRPKGRCRRSLCGKTTSPGVSPVRRAAIRARRQCFFLCLTNVRVFVTAFEVPEVTTSLTVSL